MLYYDVIRAVYRAASGRPSSVLSVHALADHSGIAPDAIRGVAESEKDREQPRLAYRSGYDEVSLTTYGIRAVEEWAEASNVPEHDRRIGTWTERARWQRIDGAVIPSGGTLRGGRENNVENLMNSMLMLLHRSQRGLKECRECGMLLKVGMFRPGRKTCKRCEADRRSGR